jgi:HEAT repeats
MKCTRHRPEKNSLKLAKRHFVTAASIILASCFGSPTKLTARIVGPPSTIDLTQLVATAPIIFRGSVVSVSDAWGQINLQAIAQLQVDRWYRSPRGSTAAVRFEGFRTTGHNCIDFKPGTRWLVFATEGAGHLELADDCFGAVEVSRLLAPLLKSADVIQQLESDFTAGLKDPDLAARLVSIQRLGGLRLASSQPALHNVIQNGNPSEVEWAVYAALRTGDVSVLPRVRQMFLRKDSGVPLFYLAWELSLLKDRSAIPELIAIADSVPDPNARRNALDALGRNIRAFEALPTIAAHLTDSDEGVRLSALEGMRAITQAQACADIEPCLVWWNRIGKTMRPSKQ